MLKATMFTHESTSSFYSESSLFVIACCTTNNRWCCRSFCSISKIQTGGADVLAEEQAHEAIFQPLPFHYIEVAHLLLRHAKDAFEEGDDVLYQVIFLQTFSKSTFTCICTASTVLCIMLATRMTFATQLCAQQHAKTPCFRRCMRSD